MLAASDRRRRISDQLRHVPGVVLTMLCCLKLKLNQYNNCASDSLESLISGIISGFSYVEEVKLLTGNGLFMTILIATARKAVAGK